MDDQKKQLEDKSKQQMLQMANQMRMDLLRVDQQMRLLRTERDQLKERASNMEMII